MTRSVRVLSGTVGDLESKFYPMVAVVLVIVLILYGFGGGFWGFCFGVFCTPEHMLSAIFLPLHFLLYWDGEKQSQLIHSSDFMHPGLSVA